VAICEGLSHRKVHDPINLSTCPPGRRAQSEPLQGKAVAGRTPFRESKAESEALISSICASVAESLNLKRTMCFTGMATARLAR
jgi:hypothetical protein